MIAGRTGPRRPAQPLSGWSRQLFQVTSFCLISLRCSRLLYQFDENAVRARRVQKGYEFSLGTAPRISAQQLYSARGEFLQFGVQVLYLITDVMQAFAALCEKAPHH